MSTSSQSSHNEILMPSVMVLGGADHPKNSKTRAHRAPYPILPDENTTKSLPSQKGPLLTMLYTLSWTSSL